MTKPVLQSLILADHVYEDKLTGKRIIAGVFNRIIRGRRPLKPVPADSSQGVGGGQGSPTGAGSSGTPAGGSSALPGQRLLEIPPTGLQSGSPFAYLSLTEVRGQQVFVLQFTNLSDNSVLFRSELKVECPNPLYTVELTVPLPPIAPPQAGVYALELLHDQEILGSLRVVVEDAM